MENGIPLTTTRLILREYQEADWKSVHEWDADADVVRYLTWDCEHTEAAAREHVQRQIEQASHDPRLEYGFVIALRDGEQPIGAIDLHLRDDRLSAWVAYRLHPAYRGRGYATEALRRVLAFSFDTLRLHRVKATVNRENIASCRVLAKCGMRYEGVECTWSSQDEAIEEAQYALLEREWASQRTEPAFSAKTRVAKALPNTTNRLYLRAFDEDDRVLFQTTRFHSVTLSLHHPLSRPDGVDERAARDFVAENIRMSNDQAQTSVAFIVARREDDRGIGVVSLTIPPDSRVGWLDVHLHPGYLHNPDAPGALRAIIEWGFAHRPIQRIGADCSAHDPRAVQILERAGMSQEACYLDAMRVDGAWQSFFAYGVYPGE